ncbi:TonB-dependent receptor plug domain-containing protein, partial [Escherichia coli]|uniref:TonB-dependent receptor plug domain-containing protein n=1 Tax=Escherichia coli TaxID=562 RepID=UPI001BC8AA5F
MTTPVTVLEGDDLVRRREATLGETLNGEPGITSSHFGTGASRPIIRGMDGPRVKVLSDGAELLDASTISPDHAVVSEPMLATQIEVLRGPSALIYGGGAVGGVV